MEDSKGNKFASEFSSLINNFSDTERKVAIQAMLRDHRSIQQGFMRFFLDFVRQMAEQHHDLRNQASVELAKEILKIDSKKLILPLI